MLEGEKALQLAGVEASSVSEELEAAREGLAERQATLDTAHGVAAEKDRRVRELEASACSFLCLLRGLHDPLACPACSLAG